MDTAQNHQGVLPDVSTHMVSSLEVIEPIKAAIKARRNPNFLISARMVARNVSQLWWARGGRACVRRSKGTEGSVRSWCGLCLHGEPQRKRGRFSIG